jgi:hypothetical protein
MVTMVSIAVVIWAVVFFLFMDGATAEGGESLRDLTWVGLILALFVGVWAGPEYMHYAQNLTILNEILELDSRSEVMRRRKEAEEAAKLLGRVHQVKLIERYDKLHIRTKKLFDTSGVSKKSENKASEGDEFLSAWWNCEESMLARALPQMEFLKTPPVHKASILISITGILALLWNSIHGIARQSVGGARDHSLDFLAMITGADHASVAAPNLDLISGIILFGLFTILAMSRPAIPATESAAETSESASTLDESDGAATSESASEKSRSESTVSASEEATTSSVSDSEE